MNLINKLKIIRENENKEMLVKRYLLECCDKLTRFRSDKCFAKNLKIAKNFLQGTATKKQIHQAEWKIEAHAFRAEFYSEKSAPPYFIADEHIKADLIKIRISKGLSNSDSKKYLIEMAYFIDHVFCHIEHSSNWQFSESDQQFLCPRTFKRYFGSKE